jgi:hypothetical protein
MYTRTGYLFLMEKKALGTTWSKCYCHYQREGRLFRMIPYIQVKKSVVLLDCQMFLFLDNTNSLH